MHTQRKTDPDYRLCWIQPVANCWYPSLQGALLCVPSNHKMDFRHPMEASWRQKVCFLPVWWHLVYSLANGRCTIQAELIYSRGPHTCLHLQNPTHISHWPHWDDRGHWQLSACLLVLLTDRGENQIERASVAFEVVARVCTRCSNKVEIKVMDAQPSRTRLETQTDHFRLSARLYWHHRWGRPWILANKESHRQHDPRMSKRASGFPRLKKCMLTAGFLWTVLACRLDMKTTAVWWAEKGLT